jgi:hypothetical protein
MFGQIPAEDKWIACLLPSGIVKGCQMPALTRAAVHLGQASDNP